MTINKYALTSTVTIPAGVVTTPVAGEPATGGVAGYGNSSATPAASEYGLWPTTYQQGQVIELDPAGAVYAAIGAGNLAAFRDGSDDVGHAAISN
jgi:hypothetical protein